MSRIIEYFKMELDWYFYDYGKNVNGDTESRISFLYEPPKPTLKERMRPYYRPLRRLLYTAFRYFKGCNDVKTAPIIFDGPHKKVLSYEYHSDQVRLKFAEKNIEVVFWGDLLKNGNRVAKQVREFQDSLANLPFNDRLQKGRYKVIDELIQLCQDEFREYSGLFTMVDAYFEQKLLIDVFKSLHIPTYVFLHGLPGIYLTENKRADYLLVWGEKIRDGFVHVGFDPQKVLVTGNTEYLSIPHSTTLRNSLDDILVLTTSTVHSQMHGWDWKSFRISDRSLLITYIYSVEKVLKSFGVKKARLRPHPMNNYYWLKRFIDNDFYELDYLGLNESLQKATLAIGPTSSTFLQALMMGVTYLIYEPGSEGYNLAGGQLVPPFDGSDPKLQVAFNEEDLINLIKIHYTNDVSILDDYIVPFTLDNVPL